MWLTKISVPKEIQNLTFADSSGNDTELFVIPRRPKDQTVAMEIKPPGKTAILKESVLYS